jgi:hypothetical protein
VDDASARAVAIVAEHVTGAYGFTMKTVANEFLHRVLPLRDPDEPRFWCVVVVRCTAGGLPDRSQPPWVGRRGLRREELPETMGEIRADLSAWLAQPEQTELREWVLVPGAVAAQIVPTGEPSSRGRVVPHATSAEGQNLEPMVAARERQQVYG